MERKKLFQLRDSQMKVNQISVFENVSLTQF